MPGLVTGRLQLRPLVRQDSADLYELLRQPQLAPHFPAECQSRAECQHLALVWEKKGWHWLACLGQKPIGLLYLAPLDAQPPGTWELGFAFDVTHWGRGFGRESGQELVSHAFTALGAKRVLAFCAPENKRSRRLLVGLGMKSRGLRPDFICKLEGGHPRWLPAQEYCLTRAAWQKNQANQ